MSCFKWGDHVRVLAEHKLYMLWSTTEDHVMCYKTPQYCVGMLMSLCNYAINMHRRGQISCVGTNMLYARLVNPIFVQSFISAYLLVLGICVLNVEVKKQQEEEEGNCL